MHEPKEIVFLVDDSLNGVLIKKGTEIKVSWKIAEDKINAKVAKLKSKEKVKDVNENL